MSGTSRSRWEFAKSEVSGRSGMVVAGKPDSAEAGAPMLEEGGYALITGVAATAVALLERSVLSQRLGDDLDVAFRE